MFISCGMYLKVYMEVMWVSEGPGLEKENRKRVNKTSNKFLG